MPPPPDSPSLTGQLLLAVPSMKDPNFKRTVILMAAHNAAEGAFGYVLNRPLDQQVADLLPEQDLGPLGQAPVYYGGPVATDKLAFASLHWNRKQGTLRCQTHLSVDAAAHEMSLGRDVRGFVGYTGWSSGQVEGEIKRRSWILSPARRFILGHPVPESMWGTILTELGPLHQLMAGTPEQVELN